MIQLAASILALGIGPILDKFSRPGGLSRAALDAFTFVAMLGLILGHILPDAFNLAGWPTLAVAGLAWFGPTFFEKRIRSMAAKAHTSALILGAFGLVIHGTIDGMSLVTKGADIGWSALAVAVILHRIPAGLTLWWLIRPRYGRLRAQLVLGGLGLTTIGGFLGAEVLKGSVSSSQEGFFQALVGGALLHVVMHRAGHGDEALAKRRQNGAFAGTMLGFALLYWMFTAGAHEHAGLANDGHAHGAGESTAGFLDAFCDIARESAPALVVAFTMAGFIQVFLPASSVRWMKKGGRLTRALKGVGFGLPLPICSCGVVPLYRSLAARGVPTAALLAFLVATPELGIDAVLLSLPLLGAEMTIVRVVAAAFVAISTAWLVASLRLTNQRSKVDDHAEGDTVLERQGSFLDAFKLGWMKFFDTTAPWIVLGIMVAAICQPLLPDGVFDNIPSWLQVPMFAVIGMPLYVCASGATPIVAMFLIKGVSPGAALAFLLTGPATNVTTFGLLKEVHGKKLAVAFVIVIIAVTVMAGYVTNEVLGEHGNEHGHQEATQAHQESAEDDKDIDAKPGALVVSDEHEHVANHEHNSTELSVANISLWLLGLGLALSLYRQGPQRFISHVFSQTDESDDHNHGGDDHGCCHDPEDSATKECGS
ncbi:MAG: uncharacterized membrane protein YraQ (UPF0718 family) [Planctomycetota bacterium]|jgi:uncharacterized membrane protein YraQ (UPF0718 family)